MRAIIIEEERFKEILAVLKSETELMKANDTGDNNYVIDAVHRNHHYHLVKWMQSQGVKDLS